MQAIKAPQNKAFLSRHHQMWAHHQV